MSLRVKTLNALNRLLAIQYRSLPMYLTYGCPWTPWKGDPHAQGVLESIVRDQEKMSQRLAEHILDRYEPPVIGEFPVEYTELNFLAMEYLVKELLYYQRQDIAEIERQISFLREDPEGRELAQEVLGSERAHLEALESLIRQPV